MANELFDEAKNRLLTYMTENFPTTEEGRMLKEAKKRVKLKKGFYIHFMVYVPSVIFLIGFALFIIPDQLWVFLLAVASWGLAIAIHYVTVFGIPGVGRLDADWEAYELEKEYKKLKYKKEMENYLKDKLPEGTENEKLELKELEKRINKDDLV